MIHVATTKWAWLKRGVVGLAAAALMVSITPGHQASAAPTEGDVLDHASVPVAGETVSNKYGIIAQYTEGVTKRILSGGTTRKSSKDAPGSSRDLFVEPTDSQKGKIKALYTNVGTFKGRELDFELVAAGWEKAGFLGGEWFMFYDTHIGFSQAGYKYVDLRGTYRYHDTGEVATDLPGSYMTVNDLDANQFMGFDSAMMSNIDKIYAYTKSTRVSYWNVDGYTNIGARYQDDLASDDEEGMVTYLVDGYEFDFRWNKDWTRPSSTGQNYNFKRTLDWYNEASAQYFGYIAKKPARSEMLEPSKTIVKADGSRVKSNNVNAGSSYTYGVHHFVPDEYAKFYYSKYIMRDTLSAPLDVTNVKVVDGSNKDVTSRFTISQSGQTVKATATSTALDSASFYNNTYTLLITVKTPSWQDAEKYANGNPWFTINNTAYVAVDSDEKASNPVTTKVIMPFDVTVKHVHKKSGKLLDTETVKRFDGEGYSFSPKTNMKNEDGYSYIPTDDKDVSGTVNGKDVTVTIYYDLPLAELRLERTQIFTAPADSTYGLPTTIRLVPKWIDGEKASDLDRRKLDYMIRDNTKSETALSGSVKFEDLDKWDTKNLIPVKKSGITPYSNGEKRSYTYRISSDDPYIVASTRTITLDGHTSSRKRVEASGASLSYTGPIMVERTYGESMKTFTETLDVTAAVPAPMKTGYGTRLDVKAVYQNELDTLPTKPYAVNTLVDPRLIDSYLDYKPYDLTTLGKTSTRMTLEMGEGTVTRNGANTVETTSYELPTVKMEQPTGNLFTPKQESSGDSRIKHPLKDAGHKLYIPVWLDELGAYDYAFHSATNAVGANQVSYTLSSKLDIEAYMFAHVDSSTKDDDELLLLPKTDEDASGTKDAWFSQY